MKIVIFSAHDATKFLRDALDSSAGDEILIDAPASYAHVDVSALLAKVVLTPRLTLHCFALNGAGITASGTETMGHAMKGANAVVVDLPISKDPGDIGRYLRHIKHHASLVGPKLVGQVAILVRTSAANFEALEEWFLSPAPGPDDLADLFFIDAAKSPREVLRRAVGPVCWLRFEVIFSAELDEKVAASMGFPARDHLRAFVDR
jgi:hypothetical protein